MKIYYKKARRLSFDDLPFAKLELISKMDNIILLLESKKPAEQKYNLFTIQEAANFLNLTKSTVYNKVSNGELSHIKKGKCLYFSNEELMTYIKLDKVKTTPDSGNGVDIFFSNYKKGFNYV